MPTLVTLAFFAHIAGGAVALLAGVAAICAPKGSRLHRRAGNLFFLSMLVMATFAAVLAVVRPGQIINLFIAGFAFYLVGTAWLAARRPDGVAGTAEKAALAVSLILCAPFAMVIFQIATGIALFRTAFRIEGAILIALCSFASVIALAAIGDARVVLAGGLSGRSRIARHLWRMCFGLTLATGSAFTNGFARFLPGPYHVPTVFFLPQFIPLIVLVYWMARVWLTPWAKRRAGVSSPQAV
jgi:hypothetical protein